MDLNEQPWCFFLLSLYQTFETIQYNLSTIQNAGEQTPTVTLNFIYFFKKVPSSTLWLCERLQQSGLLFRVCLLIYCEALHLFTPVVLADPLTLPPSVVCCCAESQNMRVASSVCFCFCPLHAHDKSACSPNLH